MKIYNFDSIPSTNDFAESIAHLNEDSIITAAEQTDGHGSKGRSFVSPRGGLYLTELRFYSDFKASKVFKVMINSSVAVCRTLERFALKPHIKWPNDVYVNGKKICGILINNSFSGGRLTRSVVGIGINITNDLPPFLKDTAINMAAAGGKDYSFASVRDELIKNLTAEYTVEEYKSYLHFLGDNITLIEGDRAVNVRALDVDELGRLIVKDEVGDVRAVAAAEVSLRLK